MRRYFCVILLAAAVFPALSIGATLTAGQSGYYGRIDIGDVPHPDLISPQPIVIKPVSGLTRPVYLHVPPGHAKDWAKHCAKYNACGEQVFFVRTQWYESVYVPHHRQRKARIEAQERAMLNRGQNQADPATGKGKEKSK